MKTPIIFQEKKLSQNINISSDISEVTAKTEIVCHCNTNTGDPADREEYCI